MTEEEWDQAQAALKKLQADNASELVTAKANFVRSIKRYNRWVWIGRAYSIPASCFCAWVCNGAIGRQDYFVATVEFVAAVICVRFCAYAWFNCKIDRTRVL